MCFTCSLCIFHSLASLFYYWFHFVLRDKNTYFFHTRHVVGTWSVLIGFDYFIQSTRSIFYNNIISSISVFAFNSDFWKSIYSSNLISINNQQEYENKIMPWLYSFAIFTSFRILATIFFGIVNDLIFAYNILLLLVWIAICAFSVYGWLVVYSLYVELVSLTKLEDLAHLRVSTIAVNVLWSYAIDLLLFSVIQFQMGTMQSLHGSTTHSMAGSRPTTPHSTVSTMPVGSEIH